jgi:sugar transferase (PEP-CTERM system associated)
MKVFGLRMERRSLLYVAGDIVLALLALGLAHSLRFAMEFDLTAVIVRASGGTALFVWTNVLMLYLAQTYEAHRSYLRPANLLRIWGSVALAFLAQMVLFYLLPKWQFGRGVALLGNLGFLVLLTFWRIAMSFVRPRLSLRRRTLILGSDQSAQVIAEAIKNDRERRDLYRVLGFVEGPQGSTDPEHTDDTPTVEVVGRCEELSKLVELADVDCIIVAVRSGMPPWLTQELLEYKTRGIIIEDMRQVYKQMTGKVPIHYLSDTSFIFGPEFGGTRGMGAGLQRLSDILFGLVGLTLSAPIILGAAIAIKRDSRGPVFYTQERVGQNERNFTIWKLRTMTVDAEAKSGAVWSQGAGDPRVTKVGRFLRRSRIDELPQFWNVLVGDMSMVGPRPERPHFVAQLKEQIPYYGLRFAVKPGVTGWAQVRYRYGASVEDSAEKLCYDLFAIQELTPLLYTTIILKTIQTVVLKPGS